MDYDCIIIGGGIIGLSTAWQLQQREPNKKILLLEKEGEFAKHQTGHNSGVIHAGIYYPPDSLKAKFCREGMATTIKFCDDNNIPYEQCGKLLVATNPREQQRMFSLFERAHENGLDVELLDAKQLQALEPHIVGIGAIHLKTTGIVNYREVCLKMAQRFHDLGGETRLNKNVIAMTENHDVITLRTRCEDTFSARFVVTCSGLMADRSTKMLSIKTDFQIIPYRGEYYQLPPSKNDLVKRLIYPIPDPDLPFLGVHLTRMIDGSVTVGPNAVQGWKREGYGTFNVDLKDCWDMLTFSGFWKCTQKHFKTGLKELKGAWWKPDYLKAVQKYCPSLKLSDLQPYPAGIRAQAVMKDGSMVHDFLFAESRRSLHVCNAPSPAATSAIPIGHYICNKIADKDIL